MGQMRSQMSTAKGCNEQVERTLQIACDLDRILRGVEVLAPAPVRARMREIRESLVAKLRNRGHRAAGRERSVPAAR